MASSGLKRSTCIRTIFPVVYHRLPSSDLVYHRLIFRRLMLSDVVCKLQLQSFIISRVSTSCQVKSSNFLTLSKILSSGVIWFMITNLAKITVHKVKIAIDKVDKLCYNIYISWVKKKEIKNFLKSTWQDLLKMLKYICN